MYSIWTKSFGSPCPTSYTNANDRTKGIDLDATNTIYSIGIFDGLIDFDRNASKFRLIIPNVHLQSQCSQ